MHPNIRLGTRGSPLALAQAEIVVNTLKKQGVSTTISIIKTSGDIITDRPLYEIGGKGLFVKEIEQALLDNTIDIAVHSLKDLESFMPPQLMIAAVLPREAPEDVLISKDVVTLETLRVGARIGTCSPRRRAYLNFYRPDLDVVPLRGNVQSRLKKLEEDKLDGIILAAAGLNRLNIQDLRQQIFPTDYIIPAVGQGVIALQCRQDNRDLIQFLQTINCQNTWDCIIAERKMLKDLDGNCRTPIAGFAQKNNHGIVTLNGMIAEESPGKKLVCTHAHHKDPITLGAMVATKLKELLS